ncbi:hypothetical protein U0070_001626 [Myodes glareolus]|uniref:Small ribosomal subunit protein eS6 n=1 Tax=Myodes glareolus TaxID=447135 RepID=A0AAW0J6M4_MYOGA
MKLNISFPAAGCQKLIKVNDEHKLRMSYEKHLATEVAADALGEERKGYMVQISGGNVSKKRMFTVHCQKASKQRRSNEGAKKNKEEAAENVKLLAKRMKEDKEKRHEQIAKRCRLSPLRASPSESEPSQK